MKLSVELTKEKGFRIRSGKNVFVCEHEMVRSPGREALSPTEMFIASLGSSIASCALSFCETQALSPNGLVVGMDWEKAAGADRISKISGLIHVPDAVTIAGKEDDFISAIHRSEIYQTLLTKPEMHFHATEEIEKPEGEALLHFVGAE
jgi:uncharacterized OsmC-like protein